MRKAFKIAPIAAEILLFFFFKKIKDWNGKREFHLKNATCLASEKKEKVSYKQKKILREGRLKKMASDLHRTATTAYPCCVPTLGESAGAGRVGLAGANIQSFYIFASELADIKYRCILL